jgi:hypothetical protein
VADEWVVDFPTLFVAADWIERHCIVPDGFDQGEPFELTDWQAWFVVNHYRVKAAAKFGQLAPAFQYRRSQVVLPQKAGKGPLTAAQVCLESVGPSLFAGWANRGDEYRCRDWGCRCGWRYAYEPGEPMGMPWPTPLVQITATSEDQTDNIYDALKPMINLGPLHHLIPKTGEEFIRLPNGGRIDVVTSNARARLGQRVTFVPWDESALYTTRNGMRKVFDTQSRGLAGMGGRGVETTNAWDPAEESVAQATAQAKAQDIFRLHPLPPDDLRYTVKRDRRRIHRIVYAGSPWVDLDSIEAEAAELLERDPGQAERFFGNRPSSGSGKAFDLARWDTLARDAATIDLGAAVTVGFDGSKFDDATGIVVTDVATGLQVVHRFWENDGSDDWEVPDAEVDAAMAEVFDLYKVLRAYCDPPYWESAVDRWAGRYGTRRVTAWWTNRPRQMCMAVRSFVNGQAGGELGHNGDPDYRRHIGNAHRKTESVRDDDGRPMWTIQKERRGSPAKIDLVMAGVLSWEARGDAIAKGALNKRKRVAFSMS